MMVHLLELVARQRASTVTVSRAPRTLQQENALLADLPSLKALMTTNDDRTIADSGLNFWKVSGNDLFGLLRRFIRNDLATLHRDGVRVRVIGEREGLDQDICALLNEAEELTKANTKLNLVVAFNYGSRQ